MKEYNTLSDKELSVVSGGSLVGKLWQSYGYSEGWRANWNLKHPYAGIH